MNFKALTLTALTLISSLSFAQSSAELREAEQLISETITRFKNEKDVRAYKKEACNISKDSYDWSFCMDTSFVLADRRLNYVWSQIKLRNPKLITSKVLSEQRAFIIARNTILCTSPKNGMMDVAEFTEQRVEELLQYVGSKAIALGLVNVK